MWAIIKRKSTTRKIPLTLLVLVFGNLLIWYAEQRIHFSFEFLSVSYLLTELCLLFIYPLSKKKVNENADVLKEKRGE